MNSNRYSSPFGATPAIGDTVRYRRRYFRVAAMAKGRPGYLIIEDDEGGYATVRGSEVEPAN